MLCEHVQRFAPVGGKEGGAPFRLDDVAQRFAHVVIIVDDQNASRVFDGFTHGAPAFGMRISNRVPAPAEESTSTLPPCAATMRSEM